MWHLTRLSIDIGSSVQQTDVTVVDRERPPAFDSAGPQRCGQPKWQSHRNIQVFRCYDG